MPERGAAPNVHPVIRRVLDAAGALSSPLLPDDYLEMINPLWSTRELRGRIERVHSETDRASTILIKPGYRWPGHKPGQYVRIGLDINGVRHWRAYSLTSDPFREDGLISITPKVVDSGKVSPYLVKEARPGTIVTLSKVEGDFVLPESLPSKLLFISAGSGVTPIMSILRHLDHEDQLRDVVHLHSAKHTDDVIFGPDLRKLEARNSGYHLHEQLTDKDGRIGPADLDRLCPDWREREAYISGPSEMLDAFSDHWEEQPDCRQLHMERFQPKLGLGEGAEGEGGTIRFTKSDAEAQSDGSKPILVAGEEGEVIRTCIHAPEGPIEIDL